ncbi:MAG TPA: VanZ family protein [Rhodocyclaceae bacterium]|nr:VanZ family protein [Rhodocyclaceae bacterium]
MPTELLDPEKIRQREQLQRASSMAMAAILILLLFILGAQPFAVGLFPEPWDKLAHFLMFSLLAGLVWIGNDGRRPMWGVLAIAAVGAADELHQRNLPGRSADVMDFLTDVIAAVSTVITMSYLRRKRRKQPDNGNGPKPAKAAVSGD